MKSEKFKNMKYYILIVVILVIAFYFSLSNTQNEEGDSDSLDISSVSSLNKLVFNLPNMDKQMCETFPRVILSAIEEMNGVVDASFEYDGHVVSVYYTPELISEEEILNNEAYSWIGTKFISEEEVDVSKAGKLYDNREKNNKLVMPGEHMEDISDVSDNGLVDSQKFPSLVSAEWLLRNRENVKVIEIGPVEDYMQEHLDGALNMDISDIRATEEGVVKQVLSENDFESLMGNLGISNDERIVIYSSKNLIHASRLYWTLKYYGHKNVAIVDGGKDGVKEVFDLIDAEVNIEESDYSAKLNEKIKVGSSYVFDSLENSDVVFLDVREKGEFDAGRIPGALNVDWTNFVNQDGILKNLNGLEEILNGVDRTKEIIIYCESGTRASYAWFVLSEVLGYENVKLYDGSMIEWRYKGLQTEK